MKKGFVSKAVISKTDNCIMCYNFKESNRITNISAIFKTAKRMRSESLVGIWKTKKK